MLQIWNKRLMVHPLLQVIIRVMYLMLSICGEHLATLVLIVIWSVGSVTTFENTLTLVFLILINVQFES